MRKKIFTQEELDSGLNKMSRTGKEFESITEAELSSNIWLQSKSFERFLEELEE